MSSSRAPTPAPTGWLEAGIDHLRRGGILAYPTETVVDPTGAGDSFAGGFMGYLAGCDSVSLWNMKRAMAYGTVCASLNVEGFGVDCLAAVERERLERRYQELIQFVSL